MKIKRVEPTLPFNEFFDSRTIRNSTTGPAVPVIDLVLHSSSRDVVWRIYGHNSSMVNVKKNVMSKIRTSIVIGGHQLEDNLLEFDLASSS
ncbi:Peptidase A1 [Corchorus olitorius]|uniref:Peptidase A1 n=1 Tax=Corchorus olitorius TaxID=93759 RepID=A0A1R3IRZ4_9ROSI|nr:Peptidase A1 [Corchorus olitorius]